MRGCDRPPSGTTDEQRRGAPPRPRTVSERSSRPRGDGRRPVLESLLAQSVPAREVRLVTCHMSIAPCVTTSKSHGRRSLAELVMNVPRASAREAAECAIAARSRRGAARRLRVVVWRAVNTFPDAARWSARRQVRDPGVAARARGYWPSGNRGVVSWQSLRSITFRRKRAKSWRRRRRGAGYHRRH